MDIPRPNCSRNRPRFNAIALASEILGYLILGCTNWRVAIGVFLVHFSINLTKIDKEL